MRNWTKAKQVLCVLALTVVGASNQVGAQTNNKMTVIKVAYPAGGPADVATRKVQARLSAALGQTVIIENVPGAGGSIGAANVLAAPADGNTLLSVTGNDLILAPLAISHVKFKPENFRLLANVFPTDFMLVTSAAYSFDGLDDLVAKTKAAGKELSLGSWGYGSAPHLVGAEFKLATGVPVLDVPYRGAAPVMQGLLSKEIDMAFVPVAASVIDHIRSGRIKAIGVANNNRNPFLPEVPTLNEGRHLKNFVHSAWAGIFVPRTAPEPVVTQLSKSLGEIVAGDEFQKFLKESAALPVKALTPQEADAYYQAELVKFNQIAKKIGLEAK
jgi:tripartite-type tricarboxylate transporter receptor subunit TctC